MCLQSFEGDLIIPDNANPLRLQCFADDSKTDKANPMCLQCSAGDANRQNKPYVCIYLIFALVPCVLKRPQ